MKIGRNEPCHCGSGKKYKKCCLNKVSTPSKSLYYQRLSEAYDRLVDRLVAFAGLTFGEDAVDVAMDEFLLWPEPVDEINEEVFGRVGPLFWPWYVFNWEYDPIDAEVTLPGPEDRTVAELYAEGQSGRLDPLESRLVESINRKPYSFYEVLSVDSGKGMTLRDTLEGTRIEVQEHRGSEQVQPGDLLFGRAVDVDGVGMLIGLAPTIIPPSHKSQVIQLRKDLRANQTVITDDTLHEWDTEIRELYFQIDEALYAGPKLCNTDGHPLEFHRLIYDVSSADEAFKKLCDLCVTATPDKLFADAKRDDADRIVRIEIPWNRQGNKVSPGMPNTILGRMVIDGRRLTAEVNSAERAAALRREIDARLGDAGRFRVDEIQDLKSMMRQHADSPDERRRVKEHEELMRHPEVREQVAEMIGKHWASWVDQEIPALGGQSPREAVKTADGREAVEALLKQAERGRGQDPFMTEVNRKGAQHVREVLGLTHQ
ncbi:MAG: SEC-C metal-binding domain-containing protein [Deltaproteobacteria bacterium]|nr:SEC-C metal-binding domain-containing protein [Deltaproteobacteria bacterium]